MADRRRLLADEASGAAAFDAVVGAIPSARRDEPTVTPDGWTPLVVLAHVAGWLDDAGRVLEQMAIGTWDPAAQPPETSASVAAVNAEQAARAAALTWSDAEAAVAAARVRARAAWEALPEITPDAWSWFEESGPNHYAKHVHDLTAWLAGEISDPDVGALLQADAEAWVAFATLLEGAPERSVTDDSWSVTDVCHHVGAWMDLGAEAIENGDTWSDDDGFDTDGFNADALDRSHGLSFGSARLSMEEARARLRRAFSSTTSPAASAKEIYRACTVEHYEEHLPMLRSLTGSTGGVP